MEEQVYKQMISDKMMALRLAYGVVWRIPSTKLYLRERERERERERTLVWSGSCWALYMESCFHLMTPFLYLYTVSIVLMHAFVLNTLRSRL